MFDLSQQSIDSLRVSRAKARKTYDKSTELPQLQAALEITRIDLELERRARVELEFRFTRLQMELAGE